MMGKTYPNLIIAGAPKCGSTTLYRYLSKHPNIEFPSIKEPGFLIAEFYKSLSKESPNYSRQQQYLVLEKDEYKQLYEGLNSELLGDASISYLYQYELAIKNIKEFCRKDVKIVFILRHPINRLLSQFKYVCELGFEPLSIEEALKSEESRLKSGWSSIYAYKNQGLYSAGIRAFMEAFENVHVMFFEDLLKSPQDEMDALYNFLDVHSIPVGDVQTFNKSGLPKNKRLHNVLMNKNPLRTLIARILRTFLSDSSLLLFRDKLRSVNQSKEEISLSLELNNELKAFFQVDFNALKALLHKPLPWKL